MNQKNNNELATASLTKLMMQFSIPCILSLLVSSLYNIVDQIFIGRAVGYLGNGATNVVFPITVIVLAFALMIGDGCAAYLSLCQGRNDKTASHRSVGNAIVLLAFVSIIFVILFAAGRETFLSLFGATENNIAYARGYFNIILIGLPFYIFTSGFNSIVRADGSPKFAMIATLIGCVLNVILDPIALFVFGWGVKGAALATIIGQIVSAVVCFAYLFRTKTFKLCADSFKLRASIVKRVLPLGISSFLTQLSIVVIMAVMNNTLVTYGALSKYGADIPMTVMGIVMKVFQIVIAFVVGIAAGCQPIIGFNYGAGNIARVKKLYRYMLTAEVIVGAIGMIAFEIFPLQVISVFGSESALYNEYAVLAFRIYLSTIILSCIQKSTSIFLQSMGKSVPSMTLSLMREFVLCAPLILLLPRVNNLGVMGPLFAAPIADVISCILALLMMRHVFAEASKTNTEKEEKEEQAVEYMTAESAV